MDKYRQLFGYIGRQRRWFLCISGLTLAASALTTLQPFPLAIIVDSVLKKEPLPRALATIFNWLGFNPGAMTLLLLLVLGGLAIFLLNSVLQMALTSAWTVAGQRIVYDLAQDLF